jgi:hypothetical protein
MPRTLAPAVVLTTAGSLLVLGAFLGDVLAFGPTRLLPLYCLGLVAIAGLLLWEATRRPTGVLPAWTSPPALIAGWTLAWIYLPSLVAFLDNDLLDDLTLARGGEAVLLAGLPLTCGALAVLSMSYHAMTTLLGDRVRAIDAIERPVPVRRMVGLYLVGTLARALRLQTLGIGFGSDLASWGPLRSLDQWIGYVDDLRLLALALLVAHVVRQRSGHLWLAVFLIVELMFGLSSGFLSPAVMVVLLCVTVAAAFHRLTARHLALVGAAAVLISTFVPIMAAIREDRTGVIGTTDSLGVGEALIAPARYWFGGVSGGDGFYDKFFGRQAEVASAPGFVVTLTPTVVPYEGFERFLALPAGLIPRVLWPDKPTLSRGVWFSSTFRGFAEDTTSSSAMTIFSEGYLFYGWIGTVVAMVIAGVLLASMRRYLDHPRWCLVYLALVPTILQIEIELSSYLTAFVQRSLVFLVVFVLLTRTKPLGFGLQRTSHD